MQIDSAYGGKDRHRERGRNIFGKGGGKKIRGNSLTNERERGRKGMRRENERRGEEARINEGIVERGRKRKGRERDQKKETTMERGEKENDNG